MYKDLLTSKNINMIPRRDYKQKILEENYRINDNEKIHSFSEYVELESQNDPNFFRWLFEQDDLSDFENPEPDTFSDFLNEL